MLLSTKPVSSKYPPPKIPRGLLQSDGKRPYLADLEPFSSAFGARNIRLQVVKGAVITLSLGMLDYNLYLERVLKQEEAEEENIEEFNFSFLWNQSLVRFRDFTARFYFTSVIRKYYENIAINFVDIRMVDRLTKDVSKSIIRKVKRFPFDRLKASQQIFFTSFYANILLYSAGVTYDAILQSMEVIKERRKILLSSEAFLWLLKKSFIAAGNLFCTSLGFAVGSYFEVNYGSTIGALVFELAGGAIIGYYIRV